jgi:hypothetical protein
MTTPRDGSTLQTEVREMREKMRAHWAISIAIALILKPMRAVLPILSLLPSIWCCCTPRQAEADALVG